MIFLADGPTWKERPDGDRWEVVPNGESSAAHGAGTGAAGRMSIYAVDAVISGRFGPKAQAALAAMGIEMWTAPNGMSAQEALAAFQAGELKRWA